MNSRLDIRSRFPRIFASLVIATLIAATPAVASWKPEPEKVPTAQESLERLDKRLAPTLAKMGDIFKNISAESDELAADAYVTLIQRVAAEGYGIVVETPWHACYSDYYGVLQSGWLLLGDSVDSYRAKDSAGNPDAAFRPQLDAALYLLMDYGTLVRGVVNCGGEPEASPTTPPQAPSP